MRRNFLSIVLIVLFCIPLLLIQCKSPERAAEPIEDPKEDYQDFREDVYDREFDRDIDEEFN